MNKYLIVSIISAVLISSLVYSIAYIPEVNSFFRNLILINQEDSQEGQEENVQFSIATEQIETFPDLSIKSNEGFKTVKFGNLKLKIQNDYKVSAASERIFLSLNDFNDITGFYYPLNSVPRKEINPDELESELVRNTYVLVNKSNIPDSFVEEAFNLGVGSTVSDTIGGEIINYEARDLIQVNLNSAGYFFDSPRLTRYKVVFLTPTKLYIFNIQSTQENVINMKKTFYNLEIEK